MHTKDSDYTLDENDVCTDCGVWHGDPCGFCGACGFHVQGCEFIELVRDINAD